MAFPTESNLGVVISPDRDLIFSPFGVSAIAKQFSVFGCSTVRSPTLFSLDRFGNVDVFIFYPQSMPQGPWQFVTKACYF